MRSRVIPQKLLLNEMSKKIYVKFFPIYNPTICISLGLMGPHEKGEQRLKWCTWPRYCYLSIFWMEKNPKPLSRLLLQLILGSESLSTITPVKKKFYQTLQHGLWFFRFLQYHVGNVLYMVPQFFLWKRFIYTKLNSNNQRPSENTEKTGDQLLNPQSELPSLHIPLYQNPQLKGKKKYFFIYFRCWKGIQIKSNRHSRRMNGDQAIISQPQRNLYAR